MEKIIENKGIKYHLVKTGKFKTNTIVLKIKAPIKKEDATIRALLPHVIQSGTAQYPNATQLRTYLENLYGATLTVDMQKKASTISYQ